MGIHEQEEQLFKEWIKHLKERVNPEVVENRWCPDGLHHTGTPVKNGWWEMSEDKKEEELWKNARIRPLFITKDYNLNNDSLGVDIRDETGMDNDTDGVYYKFFGRYLLFLYGLTHINIENGTFPSIDEARDPENYLYNFHHIPVVRMNLKKIAGGCQCSEYILRDYIKQDEELIRRQIGIYNANIIICCDGTAWNSNSMQELMTKMYPDIKSAKYKGKDSYNIYYSAQSKVIIIHEWHPSVWNHSYEDYYSPIPEVADFLHQNPNAIV